jgi:hypothetical protein
VTTKWSRKKIIAWWPSVFVWDPFQAPPFLQQLLLCCRQDPFCSDFVWSFSCLRLSWTTSHNPYQNKWAVKIWVPENPETWNPQEFLEIWVTQIHRPKKGLVLSRSQGRPSRRPWSAAAWRTQWPYLLPLGYEIHDVNEVYQDVHTEKYVPHMRGCVCVLVTQVFLSLGRFP